MEEIEEDAFCGCFEMTTVTMGAGGKTIKGGAFQDCKDMAEFLAASALLTIEGGVFSGCVWVKLVGFSS